MKIYCTGCETDVEARLTNGAEMYPNSPELAAMPFWVCDTCRAFVGTHHKTKKKNRPLGYLATPEIKRWRMLIHQTLDPLWKTKKIARGRAYKYISDAVGYSYHNGELYSAEEGKRVYEIVKELKMKIDPSPFNR